MRIQLSVIRKLDLRGAALSESSVEKLLPRAALDISKAQREIQPILDRVKLHGLSAVTEISMALDGFEPHPIWVSEDELDLALYELDPELRESIQTSISRNKVVSEATLPKEQTVDVASGAQVIERFVPVDSVGAYVPGGKAVYPSSMVMSVVPAKVAGVNQITVATPGQREFNGRPHPSVLATAKLLGVSKVLVLGGPVAIAAMAFGVPEIGLAPVRLITGPGNIFVSAAKRAVRGTVAIDSEAGTTEILVIADKTGNPSFIAADLISQAEHDEDAAAVLVTDSERIIREVSVELEIQLGQTLNKSRAGAALSGIQSALVLVESMDQALEFSNFYATEHLSIQTDNPGALVDKVINAGAVFLGDYSPVSLGDYLAGSNHVLPTGGAAKSSAGLSVHTFLRSQQIIDYQKSALEELLVPLQTFANAEGLPAHGAAISRRFQA